jgi:hypothetical protein
MPTKQIDQSAKTGEFIPIKEAKKHPSFVCDIVFMKDGEK